MKNTLEIENNCIEKGYKLIAGVDEAGRGPLAGPVVSACVIMPLDDIIEGVDDSKKLSEKKRDLLFDKIVEKAIAYKISVVSEKVIDEINILNATKMSMKECIEGMEIKPDIVLVDAVKLEMEVPCVPTIHGDALSYSIAAASILAKVSRDRIMQEYDKVYPQYLFAKHKGYGTKMHIEAIKEHGSCEIHRKTFITRFI